MDYIKSSKKKLQDEQEDFDGDDAEEDSVDSVDKATKSVKAQSAPKANKVPVKGKASQISDMYNHMNAMSNEQLADAYEIIMGEEVDQDEVGETRFVPEMAIEADFSEDLDALVESEATLSDEFKQKTAVIFESALKSKLYEEVERIESAYEERLAEEVVAQRDELVEKVDSYLNYVVENWMEENRVAIQNGLRTEIAENFMENLKGLFEESYIDVPDSKVDLVDDLAEQVEELEESLYDTTVDAIEMREQIESLTRDAIIAEACGDLAETQAEKLYSLVSELDFEGEKSFSNKVATVKESYFSGSNVSVSSTESLEESHGDVESLTEEVSPSMERYLTAMRQTKI
tara:strand:- start:607 stop:1644 length:1038 start_codon:yes stop_codon:yes gene_type:complete